MLSLVAGALAALPAQLALRWAGAPVPPASVGGTLWRGGVAIDAGHVLRWQVRGWDSLRAGAVVADLAVEGPGTALSGRANLRPGSLGLAAAGRADWALLAALRPGLALRCASAATLRITARLARGGGRSAEGSGVSEPGTCDRLDGTVTGVPLPALRMSLATGTGGIALDVAAEDSSQPLAEARLTPDDRVQFVLRQAAAAMVPGLPAGGDFALDLPLSAVLR